MAKYSGRVIIYATLVVDGDSPEDADERAQEMDKDTLASMIDWDRADWEVFPDTFPEPY